MCQRSSCGVRTCRPAEKSPKLAGAPRSAFCVRVGHRFSGGGRFVTGFVGEQFALPEALDELRGHRMAHSGPPGGDLCKVAATDPLNLAGILSPGARVPAVLGNAVLYRDGVPIASLESGEVVIRVNLEPGASVDENLIYHAPPRRNAPQPQVSLPL